MIVFVPVVDPLTVWMQWMQFGAQAVSWYWSANASLLQRRGEIISLPATQSSGFRRREDAKVLPFTKVAART